MIFKKKKEQEARKEVSGDRVVVPAIKDRRPYADYHPVDYRINQDFVNFHDAIDIHLNQLASAGALDDGNGNALDKLIRESANIAIAEIERQRAEHRVVMDSIINVMAADEKQFQKEEEAMGEKLKRVEMEYEELYNRYQATMFADEIKEED